MKKKTYKQLEKENLELKLKEHTKKYIHITRFNLLPLLGIIVFGFLSIINLKLFNWNFLKVVFCSEEVISNYTFHFSQLINIYPILGECILICLAIISLTALIRGGYKKLRKDLQSYNKERIIPSIIVGILVGSLFGIVNGSVNGIISGFVNGIVVGSLIGIIGGIIDGIISIVLNRRYKI